MVTRSGTNAFSGSVFWVNHNSALDANSWFNNFNNVAKSYDNRNQFGGRIGGPIIRNKTFFFFLFEGQRDLKRQNATGNTLTAMARQGIFRYFPGADNANANNANPTVDRNGNPVKPANATGDLAAIDLFGNCTFTGAAVANCRTYRDPLRPAISTSAYMQETLKRMPLPNEFTGGDGLNTAVIRFTRRVEGLDLANGNGTDVNRDQYTLRIDHISTPITDSASSAPRRRPGAVPPRPVNGPGRGVRRPGCEASGRVHHHIHVDPVPYAVERIPSGTETVDQPSILSRPTVLMRSAQKRLKVVPRPTAFRSSVTPQIGRRS